MNAQVPLKQISVQELKQWFEQQAMPVILDVREPHELAIASLPPTPASLHIPLGQLESRLTEIEQYKDKSIVVYCRSGGRSMVACNLLKGHGFTGVQNLAGGILAWSREIDPAVRQY